MLLSFLLHHAPCLMYNFCFQYYLLCVLPQCLCSCRAKTGTGLWNEKTRTHQKHWHLQVPKYHPEIVAPKINHMLKHLSPHTSLFLPSGMHTFFFSFVLSWRTVLNKSHPLHSNVKFYWFSILWLMDRCSAAAHLNFVLWPSPELSCQHCMLPVSQSSVP